jgi:hypothetical protein
MVDDQLGFASLLEEADARARAIRDEHLGRVQEFFDQLAEPEKLKLARYMTEAEYDTCLALSVAACDWFRAKETGNEVSLHQGGRGGRPASALAAH